jgi:hypothetical protein
MPIDLYRKLFGGVVCGQTPQKVGPALGEVDPEDCQGPGVYWDPETGDCASAPIPDCPNGHLTQMTDAQGNPMSPMYCVPNETQAPPAAPPPGAKPSPKPAPALPPAEAEAPSTPKIGSFGIGALIVLGVVVVGTIVLA